jgi:protein ImuB
VRREGAPRVLALCVPDLPLQRIARTRDGAAAGDARPLATMAEGRIIRCDAAAHRSGVRPGATVAEALAACGRLVAVPEDATADRAALRALADAMLALVPALELSPPDALLLDASAAHLLRPLGTRPPDVHDRAGVPRGAAEQEVELARRALAAAAEMGYTTRAAIVTGRGPARAVACHAGASVVRVPPGDEADALAALPLTALGISPAVAARLAALGIASADALAALPEGTLAHRFGPEGVLAARLARGEDGSPLAPYVPVALPEEALDLDAPAELAEPLLFVLKRLADRVAARLAGRALGATRLKIVLRLDPRGEERFVVPLAAPTAVAGRWLLPLKEHLFSLRLPAAVVGVRLAAIEVAPVLPEQIAIGDRPEALAALEGVLSRLAVRLGEGAVFAAEPVERHRPEGAYRAVPFLSARSGAARGRGTAASGALSSPAAGEACREARPTRLLAVPTPVVGEGEGGRVTALRVDGRPRAVIAIEGPERLRGEWWAAPFDRDYYRVRLDGLGDCWVYRDGGDGRLYLHGFFD